MLIYVVVNMINKKKYIGQTVRTLTERRTEHLKPSSKACLALKSSLDKYGRGNFNFHIVQTCNSIEELNEREIYWIERLNTVSPNGYNLEYGGGNTGLASDITKKKMSDNYEVGNEVWTKVSEASKANWERQEYRGHLSECRKVIWKIPEYKDRHISRMKELWSTSDHREKVSKSMKEFWKSPESDYLRDERSKTTSKLKSKRVSAYLPDKTPFISLLKMKYGKDIGLSGREAIRRSCKNGTPTLNGYIWRYVDE